MKSSIIQATPGINRAKRTILWAALLLAALQARAVIPTYFWDTNGTDDGPGNPPDSVWAWNTMNWTSDPNGDSPTFANPGRVNIVFAATGGAYWTETYDYTVTIQGVAQVSDIVIQDGHCTLTNDFGYLDKDTPYISVLNDGQTATIHSVISSASGTANGITKYAWGTLVLGGTNTYQGPTTIEGGTLQLAAPQVLPRASTLVLAGGDTRTDGYTYGYSSTSATFATGSLGSRFYFVLPTVIEIGSNLILPAGLCPVAALQPFQHNLPLLFRGSLDSRLSRHSRLLAEAPSLTNFRVQF